MPANWQYLANQVFRNTANLPYLMAAGGSFTCTGVSFAGGCICRVEPAAKKSYKSQPVKACAYFSLADSLKTGIAP